MKKIEDSIRKFALGFPETTEDFPWGHSAFKVKKKTFLFMSNEGGQLSMSMKLPRSRREALRLPFCSPTHYGLGKSGWITSTFGGKDKPPVDTLRAWIEESYQAIAPKKLAALRRPAAAKSG
jgi:predicted DNA-binding protein (MmcQ/YjbR family)